MANFFNRKNIFDDYAQNMQPLQPVQNITGYQLDNSGNLQNINTPEMAKVSLYDRLVNPVKQKALSARNKLSDMLLGQQAQPTDNITDTTGQTITTEDGQTYTPINATTISENPRTGGLLRDMASGYQENRFTPASLGNFGQNTTLDGHKKGFGYRLGEGLGSLARFGESPLGRSLIVGGLVGATGGNPLEMLAYGAQTGLLNQQNRMADQMYRNQLAEQGIDTSNLRGYINDNTFKNASSIAQKIQKQQLDYDIKNSKNNIDLAGKLLNAFNHNIIDVNGLASYMQMYGLTAEDFKTSNETNKTNAQIETMLNPDKYQKTVTMRYEGLPTEKTVNVNNTYEHLGGTGSKYAPSPLGSTMVKIKAPNGKIKNIPANQVNAAIAAGGVRV